VPEAVIVGAGPGGLAAAAMLQRTGVETVVVDRAPAVASTWHGHYDRLHLHTVRWLSHLPGYRIPRRYGRWVARDDVVRYLESYCARHRLDVCLNTEVTSIDRAGDSWVVRTVPRAGERSNDGIGDIQARYVVVATGHNDTPVMPDWPGVDGFPGEIVHASDYRNATPYVGRSVLVVGSGNTGAEIAVDLVESGAREVAIAVRTPPHIVLREKYGVPSLALAVLFRHLPPRVFDPIAAAIRRMDVGDLTAYGLATPKDGLYERIRRDDAIPLIDVGFLRQLKAGRIVVVPAVDGFQGGHVLLADGSRRRADVVIAATGYRRGLRPLVGHLGLLDDDDRPRVRGGATDPAAPRMWFTGFTNPISGMFRELGIDAKRIARAVVLDRSQARPGSPLVDVLRVSAPGVLPGREPVRS
jgi:putative flavoprotein involved in K+ transport